MEKGRVRNVLCHVAQALGLKLACDDECFYLYKEKSDIKNLERSLLLFPGETGEAYLEALETTNGKLQKACLRVVAAADLTRG